MLVTLPNSAYTGFLVGLTTIYPLARFGFAHVK